MLTRVSITGADDGTAPRDLAALSKEFPFVEWGILYSSKREGTTRYPSREWRTRLREVHDGCGLNLALHLCGAAASGVIAGERWWLDALPVADRVQLNGYAPPAFPPCDDDREYILQVRSEDALQGAADDATNIGCRASLLFDASGGRGIEPARWPVRPFGPRMGYAGGIGPANVLDVLRDIGPVDGDFWIDMESGVRADDKFDLALVRAVLKATAPYVVTTDATTASGGR